MKNHSHDDEIRELLRQGDPAAGDPGLDADEATRMRRRILAEETERKAPSFRPIPALAAAATIVLVVLTGWQLLQTDVRPPTGEPEVETVVAPGPGESERRTRQIQFSTPWGTRIIWLLDSEFEV